MTQQAHDLVATWGNPDDVITIEPVSADDVERAHQDMIIAADLVEVALYERMPRHVIEQRQQDMYSAVRRWEKLSDLRQEQAEMAVA